MVKSVILTRDKILFNSTSLNINEEGNIDISGTITGGGDISGNIVFLNEYNNLEKVVIGQENFISGLSAKLKDIKKFINYPPEPEPELEPEPEPEI